MSEPRTEAGRALLAAGNGDDPIQPDDWYGAILAIEAEAALPSVEALGWAYHDVHRNAGFGAHLGIPDATHLSMDATFAELILAALRVQG